MAIWATFNGFKPEFTYFWGPGTACASFSYVCLSGVGSIVRRVHHAEKDAADNNNMVHLHYGFMPCIKRSLLSPYVFVEAGIDAY